MRYASALECTQWHPMPKSSNWSTHWPIRTSCQMKSPLSMGSGTRSSSTGALARPTPNNWGKAWTSWRYSSKRAALASWTNYVRTSSSLRSNSSLRLMRWWCSSKRTTTRSTRMSTISAMSFTCKVWSQIKRNLSGTTRCGKRQSSAFINWNRRTLSKNSSMKWTPLNSWIQAPASKFSKKFSKSRNLYSLSAWKLLMS